MAAGVRLLGGEELRDARIATLLSWVFLLVGILVGARFSSFPQIWYGALLAALVFPHAVTATATALTEGPALLFATLGALTWIESASRPTATPSVLLLGILGGLSMGIAGVGFLRGVSDRHTQAEGDGGKQFHGGIRG